MNQPLQPLASATATIANLQTQLTISAIVVAVLLVLGLAAVLVNYGALWFQAYMSGARVTFASLIGMTFRRVESRTIVTAKILAKQAGLGHAQQQSLRTERLEAHFLAGGDVMHVMRAIIAAHRAGIDLDFDGATAVDLAGRDVLGAVQTSVSPRVIDCPDPGRGSVMLSAVAKNGVELRVRARVTVRTNLDQLIGGATDQTIIARVGQGMISAVGSSESHMDVLEMPSRISKSLLERGLDSNTAFEIVSIDVTDVDVGENIGARLQIDQAAADVRMARALAERRRAEAIAQFQQMRAKVAENRAALVLAEAEVPSALAEAFRAGNLCRPPGPPSLRVLGDDDLSDEAIA